MRTRKLAAGLAALTMVVLAACGSDSKSSSATDAAAAPAATPAGTAAPAPAATAAPVDTTPAPIVDSLNKEIKAMLQRDDIKKTIGNMGATGDWATPQQFSDFVEAETTKFAAIIKQEGLQMDVN